MPSVETPFGKYLAKKKLQAKEVSEQLDVTRSYVHALANGHVTPALILAHKIEEWSDGKVPMASWVPYFKKKNRVTKIKKKK